MRGNIKVDFMMEAERSSEKSVSVYHVLFPDFGFLYDVRSEFTDDVSELPVGSIFTGQMEKNSCSFDQRRWGPQDVPNRRL
jgi:hypothetical protein